MRDARARVDAASRNQLRDAATRWLLLAPPPPPFLRAKLAQLFAALAAADTPRGAWPHPLAPLLAALPTGGPPAASALFAALHALHEDVISLEFGARPPADVAAAWFLP